jgi:hypothetical protein
MAIVYKFKAVYTKDGMGTSPSVAPVFSLINSANTLLVEEDETIELDNMPGVYVYEYTAPATEDILVGLFHTDDTTVDKQDLYDYTPTGIAQEVWDYDTRTLSSFSNVARDIWAYRTRTLTQFLEPPNADSITFYNCVTNVITIADVDDQSEIWFTIKRNKKSEDSESILQISKSSGLLYLEGAAPVAPITGGDGELEVINGNLVITLSGEASTLLVARSGMFGDVKIKTSEGVLSVPYVFEARVLQTVTKSTE